MDKGLYIHAESEHYLAQKWAFLCTLIHHTKTICDVDSLEEEMEHLKQALKKLIQQPGH